MSASPLPALPFTTTSQANADRLGWAAGQSFSAYGLRFGLRVSDAVILDAVCDAAPFGWQTAPPGAVDVLYSLRVAPLSQAQPNEHLLSCGSALIARALDLEALLTAFTKHAELLTAYRAQDCLFVHAGVVGWQERAIVIPGRSFSGKTTLVKALVEAKAVVRARRRREANLRQQRGGAVHVLRAHQDVDVAHRAQQRLVIHQVRQRCALEHQHINAGFLVARLNACLHTNW